MSVSVPVAQVQPDKLPSAIGKITLVDLLGVVIQLVSISAADVSGHTHKQMRSMRVAHRCSALE